MTNNRGVFICLEGIDGSGKTTQARRLVKTLIKKGYDAVYTTEPSKGLYGKIIRKQLLQRNKRVPIVVEALLFAVDRIDHIEKEINPLLDAGKVIICDRYVFSSIAYQGASDFSQEWIKEINKHAIKPDLGLYIDVLPELMDSRIHRAKSVMETKQTQRKVREIYLKLVKDKHLVHVYGRATKREVAQTIEKVVFKFLERIKPSA
ncbi:MAG: dTMP kinase [Candidatus Bathyarchaeota archaeon]|nr:MAG: dTMP kinase [Candidatus Bathyarchaeota archaeon]